MIACNTPTGINTGVGTLALCLCWIKPAILSWSPSCVHTCGHLVSTLCLFVLEQGRQIFACTCAGDPMPKEELHSFKNLSASKLFRLWLVLMLFDDFYWCLLGAGNKALILNERTLLGIVICAQKISAPVCIFASYVRSVAKVSTLCFEIEPRNPRRSVRAS